jgi:high affinity Mn2+ porin
MPKDVGGDRIDGQMSVAAGLMREWVAGIALGALSLHGVALAADSDAHMAVPAPVAAALYDWTGFYVGAHVGYGAGSLGPGTNALPLQAVFFPHSVTGMIGGYQVGTNWQLASRVVLGAEADISFPGPLDRPKLVMAPFNTTFDHFGTVRGRIGYAFGTVLPYATGGLAFGRTLVDINDGTGTSVDRRPHTQYGWVAGAGVEVAIGGNWTGKVEYTAIDLGARTFSGDGLPGGLRLDPKLQTVKLGMNYRLWDTPPWNPAAPAIDRVALPDPDGWSIHDQTTLITQAYPKFRAPYAGANSLPTSPQGRETWTADALLGWRLWEGGELYFNPELSQGFGIGGTLGLAGFPNGEAQKGGAEYPRFRPLRYYLRQTFGLGGDQEDVPDGPLQVASRRDIDRVTVIVGRFAVGDFFDGNSSAKDPRADFMNWALWASAAFDFPADLPGFTRGAVVELNRKDWALRAGLFQVPAAPNSDVLTSDGVGSVLEFEERHTLFEQPGKLRLAVFANRGFTGNYRDALGLAAVDTSIDINTAMTTVRRQQSKYGFYINAEQQVVQDVGVFARASWNDGHNEDLSFTDVDRSLSGGVSIRGSHWDRPSDTFGLGVAVNGLSRSHRDFFAAGGTGLFTGDGRLTYRPENILETYYALALGGGVTLTADYQLIVNPAYNSDRGPVSVVAGRVHAEF